MAMRDCEDCWNTPCTCGADWSTWSTTALRKQIDRLEQIIDLRPHGHDEGQGWPRANWRDLLTPDEKEEQSRVEREAQETRNDRWKRFQEYESSRLKPETWVPQCECPSINTYFGRCMSCGAQR